MGSKSMLVRMAIAICAVVAPQLALVEPASAATTFMLRNRETLLCLDGSVSLGVRLNTCDGTSRYQRWTYYDDSTNALMNAAYSTLCLDGSASQGLRLLACSRNGFQNWVQPISEHWCNVEYGNARSLDGSVGGGVQMKVTNTGNYQKWQRI